MNGQWRRAAPLYTTTTSQSVSTSTTTAQSHCHQRNSRGEPAGGVGGMSTHQQPQVYRIRRKRTSASPTTSSYLEENKNILAVGLFYDVQHFSVISAEGLRQCSEAITLSIGKHKHILVMAICWHPVWRQKIVKTEEEEKKKRFWCCHVDSRLRPHIVPPGRKKSSFLGSEGLS